MRTTYTPEEDDFLRTHYDDYSWEKLTELLNATFGTSRKFRTVKCHCRETLKLPNKSKSSQDYATVPSYAIGTEKWENGYLWVKVNDVKGSRKDRGENWIQKQRLVWSQTYGEIPDGYQIVFLDQNRMNFDIDNLYCLNQRAMIRMIRNDWFTNDRELTLTAIKLCELHLALNEVNYES